MIPIPSDVISKIQVLAGEIDSISNSPTRVCSPDRISFLAELSKRLLAHKNARGLPDVISYAYWLRRSNLIRISQEFSDSRNLRMGLGLSFHVCPANVPINFAFSMAFGLLSGNTCVLRLPTANSPTLDIMVEVISELLRESAYVSLRNQIVLIRFERNDDLLRFWMSVADGRIVWGGDATVDNVRKMPCRPRSREIAFPDRYSITVIDPVTVSCLSEKDLHALGHNLFNDIYLMDQAACSSPQLLLWVGEKEDAERAKNRLWPEVERLATLRYEPQAVQIMNKYVEGCLEAINNQRVIKVECQNTKLYRVELSGISERQDECRGYYGTIHEVTVKSLAELAPIVTEKYQTLTYFGMDSNKILNFIDEHRLRGIDRVVPIGRALDMDVIWDGYEIIPALSRRVVID